MADEDLSNTTIRRFDLTRLIARGGMGEVYLAKDAVLGRDLALKILRQDVTRDSDRLERFVLEARAASALNHPHLIAIYDIGESAPKRNGTPVGPPVLYIAMELVAGETLRAAIDGQRLDLRRTLDFLAQVADALDAAHAAGVTHRDLKPENLMLAEGGYAKVLDFGIAKLRADFMQSRAHGGAEPTATNGGHLLGTLGYMSPEQVQGQQTDHRTDVFSFGCVLYEAITGKRAFLGDSAFATLKQIVEHEPGPLSRHVPHVPDGLERICGRCLAKDPTQRYASMREVAADLRDVRRKMDDTGVVTAPERETRRYLWPAAVAVVALVATAVWWATDRDADSSLTSSRVSIERLTTIGSAIDAAVSPDGTHLAWVDSEGGMQALRIRRIPDGQTVELVPAAAVGYWGIAFTPDASRLFYATKSAQNPAGRLSAVSIDGGASTPILDWIDSTTSFSPDGRQMTFYRAGYPQPGATSLMVADTNGESLRVLATLTAPEFFVPAFFAAPSWSPDGERVSTAVHNAAAGDAVLATFDVQSGARQDFPRRFRDATFTSWLPDGSGILFIADQADQFREYPRKVWFQPYPSGEPHRVTPDLLEYRNVSVRADGAAFVSVGLDASYSLWRIPLRDGGSPQRLSSERYDGLLGIAPLPDGRTIVSSGERGNTQLSLLDKEGGGRRILTKEGTNIWPAVTPDGSTVAFVSNRDGQTGIWRMNVDGSGPRLLAHVPRPSWLSVTPKGEFVVFASVGEAGTATATWRLSIEGGEPTLIAADVDRPAISPDGRFLAGINVAPRANRLAIVTMPLDGSARPRELGPIAPATANGLMEWIPDGSGILFSTVERTNVWLQPLSGEPPMRITDLATLDIVRGRRAPDGQSLILARGTAQTDAYLVSSFR
jgi:serine/threonine protein kinase/Tol biopolymer transport system component